MPPGVVTAPRSSSVGCFCAFCGVKPRPYFSDNSVISQGKIYQLISENFLTVKGAALFLPRGNGSSPSSASRLSQLRSKHAGDIQQHLQTMFTLLRPEDNIKLAVRLESSSAQATRYMVVVSTIGRQDTEESVVLGTDFSPVDGSCSVGLVLPLWSDTLIHLDGDGGFSVSTDNRVHVFKPVSVQAMWSALQSLHKACEVARSHNYFPGSLFLTWVSYYQSRVSSDQARINEWNAMQDVQSHRADSPVLFSDVPTERELTERQIKASLREIMMQKDLENVTCKEIRTELEMHMTCNLREFKEFIDKEMIVILGQMDSPTEIFDHVFLGSEWNASNLEELQKSGVQYILNVTREIDNFFPGVFEYNNIRVYDEETTDLLAYWNDTYKFISRAKKSGAKCLVHCKMGISRSAATVIAYAMKEYGWDLNKAFDYVKERRTVTKPNPSFMRQLEEYQGILLASKQRHNKLWRSHSDSDLSEHHEPLSQPFAQPSSLGRSDPHNQAGSLASPSVRDLLDSLGTSPGTAKAASQPQSSPLDSQTGSTALEGGAAPSIPTEANLHADNPPHSHDSTASSVLPPPISNGVCHSEERHAPPSPLKAATVLPEPHRTDLVTVAQSVSVGQPHPPASVHHPPPRPASSSSDEAVRHQVPSSSPTLGSVSEPVTVQQTNPPSLSPPALVSKTGSEQQTPGSPPPCSIDNISHPNAVSQDKVLLFGHSADHINFFNAREKFKEMSHDGKSHSAAGQQKSCAKDHLAQDAHDGEAKEENRKEVNVPVQVTGAKPSETFIQPEPQNSHNQEDKKAKQEAEEQDVLTQKAEGEEAQNKEDEEAAPPRLYSDWTRGSVRRVTQQLERRMKQEHEGSPHSSQRRPHSFHSVNRSPPRDALNCEGKKANAVGLQGTPDKNTKAHNKLWPTDSRFLSTSPPFQPSAPSPFASVNFLCLEGVTELESGVDWDCVTKGAHSYHLKRDTWETLCELGAFLQHMSTGGGCRATSSGSPPKQGASFQKRVREVEARIRQAGLTPPSQMKRSASLAKLGCLEVLANELSEWAAPPPAAQPSAHTASDEVKKQRVHSSVGSKKSDALESPAERLSGAEEPSAVVSPPSSQGGKPPNAGQDDLHTPSLSLLTTRQQYGKTHPLRQLQKRTVSPLFHSMQSPHHHHPV